MVKPFFLIAVFLCTAPLACSAKDSIVIFLDIQGSKPIVHLDGNVIETEDLYAALVRPLTARGRNTEVSVVFDSQLVFSEVINLRGLIQAVGFANIRFYYLSADRTKMAEVEMNKAATTVPFDLKEY